MVDQLLRRHEKTFWTSAASHRNALALYEGEWASDLAEIEPTLAPAGVPLFRHDPRPRHAAHRLGREGRFDGMNILELGPLEGAHSFQLEQLGAAEITAVESNADAFLKCLIIKNRLKLDKTTFLLGDCLAFLKSEPRQYDLIFASGILYHMEKPLELIHLMAQHTSRVFLWTMYYDGGFTFENGSKLPHRRFRTDYDGLSVDTFQVTNKGRFDNGFWGGNRLTSSWLELDSILRVFRYYGFTNVDVVEKDREVAYGPNATIVLSKPA